MFISHLPHEAQGSLWKREQRLELVAVAVSSKTDNTAAHRDSQHSCTQGLTVAEDVCMLNTCVSSSHKIPVGWGGAHQVPTHLRSYGQLMASGEGSQLSSAILHPRAIHAPGSGPIPVH